MKRSFAYLAVVSLLSAALHAASVVVAAGDSIVHALPGSIRVSGPGSTSEPALLEGLAYPGFGVVSAESGMAAIFDPIEDRAALVDSAGMIRFVELRDSPTAAAFLGTSLFVVSRDEGTLTRLRGDGEQINVASSGRPGFLSIAGGAVFTYDPIRGLIERFDPDSLEPAGTLSIDRFASDFETDGRFGYLAVPGTGEVISFSLASLDGKKSLQGGAVPVDVAIEHPSGPLSGATLAIADPSSRRIWRIEGQQSAGAAFGRGFLRGLIGLGLYSPRSSALPAGVDRIESAAGGLLAFDSSSGTLYRITGRQSAQIATGLDSSGYAWDGERVFYSLGGILHSVPLRREH
ncbi:MAG: hypothetical protein ABR517_09995 [Thermoanaerobaculia bacterium]